MGRSAEKESSKARAPNISIRYQSNPEGLAILIQMPAKQAKVLAELANARPRAKSRANAAVLGALHAIQQPQPRPRDGLLQGGIPGDVKAELIKLGNDLGRDGTALLRDKLYSWLNQHTGNRRFRVRGNGSKVYYGPQNLRKYVSDYEGGYGQARKTKTLERYQFIISKEVADKLRILLRESQLTHGEFITALAVNVCEDEKEKMADISDKTSNSVAGN